MSSWCSHRITTYSISFILIICHFFVCQIEQLKQELNRKESEMQALQTKLETLTNQNSDCKQHIDVLKESLNAKEQRANTLQTEVSPNTHARSQERQPYDSLDGNVNRLVDSRE